METCKKIDKKIVGWKLNSEVKHDISVKTDPNRPSDIQQALAPKRPKELVCDIKKAKVNGEAWTIFVGLLNGNVYEIFGGLSKYIDIPNKYKTGKIIKNGKTAEGITSYNLSVGEGDDQMIIKDIANLFENKTNEAFTRLISLNLRHGTPIKFIVDQISKDQYAEITSFSKVIARTLKPYITEHIKPTSDKKCPQCNLSGTFIYQEGCLSCSSCGYSKCG